VTKAKIIEKIAELVQERKIEGITDLRDETDRSGLRVVIELARGANPNVILNQLYKYTPMQVSYGIILLALVDGQPRVLTLRQMLLHYLDHQKNVIIRRTRHDLEKAEARAHILEGLRIALDHIDAVITLIRQSRTVDEARTGLMEGFNLTEKQAQAILDMRLQRLTGLEREKVEEEYQELLKEIEYLRAVLGSERMVLDIIKRELLEIRERYGDARRTKIVAGAADFEVEDLIAEEDVVITLTHRGYIKRLPVDTYRSQRRGGRGVTGIQTREEDFVSQLFIATTHEHLLFFTNRGKVYHRRVHEVPEAGRTARGTAVVNLIEIERDEQVTAVIPVREFDDAHDLVMATRNGVVKRTSLVEFSHIRRGGLIALTLDEGDELVGVQLTDGRNDLLLVTRGGQAIRFPVSDVRVMGRAARGVMGIRLEPGDQVVGMEVVDDAADLLVVTERGFGKRTPLKEFRSQGRGGKGIRAISITPRNGPVADFEVVRAGEEVMLVSQGGIVLRVPVEQVSVQGRAAQGVTIMRLEPGDRVSAVATLAQRGE
ncbi:MAG TPA: DNA gyrase C-terminal beta-propeller domain-containing protein, partial [Thermaerobacter sp.]